MMKNKIQTYKKSIDWAFHYLEDSDQSQLENLKNDILETTKCGGKIVFTGVGKNVYACQKLAASYSSIGIPAFFLDAVHAVHGDLGVLSSNDLIICQSKSGNTAELVNTLTHIKSKPLYFNQKIWGIDCSFDKDSKFSELCDETLSIYIKEEIDSLGMVPTVSAIMLQIIGDLVGVQAAEELGFNRDLFALNHPGGSIGKSLK